MGAERHFSTYLVSFAAMAAPFVPTSAHAQVAVRTFDVAAQPAASGIVRFAQQAGIQILAPSSATHGQSVARVKGRYNISDGLRQLISGSDLRVQSFDGRTAVLASGTRVSQADIPTFQPSSDSRYSSAGIFSRSEGQTGAISAAAPGQESSGDTPPSGTQDIVVRGIRTSLGKAAENKRNADQVVDSIVAEDIGKFPDPTVASALQRVPGVQVSVSGNNEIVGPIIRGLGDILSTLNGREIFTGTSRGFAFQDLPAEALAGADVYKSNSANLIEGGVAGVIDLKLHKAFDFKKLTVAGTARGTYTPEGKRVNPTVGLLVADRWDTGIGEIGALVDVSYSKNFYSRKTPFNDNLRGFLYPVPGADGIVSPTAETFLNQNGDYERPQANFSLQWKPSPGIELYTEGLYAGFRTRYANNYSLYDTSSAQSLTDVVATDDCHDYLINSSGFYDPNGTVAHLCTASSYTANNAVGEALTEAHHATTDFYLIAQGAKYDRGPLHATLDLSWQRSKTIDNSFSLIIGKPLSSFTAETNYHQGAKFSGDASEITDPNDYRLAGMSENYTLGIGTMFATAVDATLDVGGLIENIQGGARYANRRSRYQGAYLGANPPGGFLATTLASVGLENDTLSPVDYPGRINDGGSFLAPDNDLSLSQSFEDQVRAIYGLPLGQPDYQPERGFDAAEKTYASYVQAKYDIPISGPVQIDGLIGFRLTRTDRDINGSGVVIAPDGTATVTPVAGHTSDTDFLPNASARLRFGGGLQARATFSKTISRPDFGSLNPGLNYTVSTNQYVLNSGSAGNPDLRPEKATSFDATLEYYFGKNDYFAAGVYHKKISDRVTGSVSRETIAGIDYNIYRPRNIGSATLKGLEVGGQAFFDFLPGALSGLGAFGNFTIADSKVTTQSDNLYGYPLTGVSKYSYNAGLLYEKFGASARVVYTWRSKSIGYDLTLAQDVRPVDDLIYVNENRPLGRLDFGLSYDITKGITVSIDGTNVLRAQTKSYRAYEGRVLLPRDISYDDSSYSLGVRFLF